MMLSMVKERWEIGVRGKRQFYEIQKDMQVSILIAFCK